MNYRVNVYTIDTAYSPFKDPHKILISPGARQTGGASESVKNEIPPRTNELIFYIAVRYQLDKN
jgi:hypothetical protein